MKRILICEDDESILAVCELLLNNLGFKVITCDLILDIFELVDDTKPDLILMDLWIPGIGGEKATHLLKLSNRHKHIPVILFSAINTVENIAKITNADGFIKKPFDIQHFENIVKEHLTEKVAVS